MSFYFFEYVHLSGHGINNKDDVKFTLMWLFIKYVYCLFRVGFYCYLLELGQ